MFPEYSGVYLAQREDDLYVVKVKGVYPTLALDKNALDLGEFLRSGKTKAVDKTILDNMELMHQRWLFTRMRVDNVFSNIKKNEFTGVTSLYASEEDVIAIRSMYYRLCQQGVSPFKIIRALTHEFKTNEEQIIKLVNGFDKQANFI